MDHNMSRFAVVFISQKLLGVWTVWKRWTLEPEHFVVLFIGGRDLKGTKANPKVLLVIFVNLNSITYIEVSYALIKAASYQIWQFCFDTYVTFSSKLSALHCATVVWYCKKLQTLFLN